MIQEEKILRNHLKLLKINLRKDYNYVMITLKCLNNKICNNDLFIQYNFKMINV